MSLRIASRIDQVDELPTLDSPRNEPSFTLARTSAVRAAAGRTVNGFLDRANALGWEDSSFGVFVYNTVLVPNSWPVRTPGWHADGEADTDIDTPFRRPVEHLICSWTYEGVAANTEYALGECDLEPPATPRPVAPYQFSWLHSQVEDRIKTGVLTPFRLKNGNIYHHDDNAVHRTPWIVDPGRRLLMIATRFVDPYFQAKAYYGTGSLDLTKRVYTPNPDGLSWGAQSL